MRSNKWTVLLMLSMVAGCGSLTTPKIATVDGVPTKGSDTPAPRFILCSQDPLIGYSAPKAGQEEDRANAFDSPETIGADAPASPARGTIRFHNITHIAACGGKDK